MRTSSQLLFHQPMGCSQQHVGSPVVSPAKFKGLLPRYPSRRRLSPTKANDQPQFPPNPATSRLGNSSLTRTTRFLRSVCQYLYPTPSFTQETQDPDAVEPLANPHALAVWEAQEFIRSFISENWSNHASSITIHCDIPLSELLAIGQLPEPEGCRACRRLVRVPVIHEEVAASLWRVLVEGDGGSSGRESFSSASSAWSLSVSTSTSSSTGTSTSTNSTTFSLSSERPRRSSRSRRQKQKKQKTQKKNQQQVRACAYCSNTCPFNTTRNQPPSPNLNRTPDRLPKQKPLRKPIRLLTITLSLKSRPPSPPQCSFWQTQEPPKPRTHLSSAHTTKEPPSQTGGDGGGLMTRLRGTWRLTGWGSFSSGSGSSGSWRRRVRDGDSGSLQSPVLGDLMLGLERGTPGFANMADVRWGKSERD